MAGYVDPVTNEIYIEKAPVAPPATSSVKTDMSAAGFTKEYLDASRELTELAGLYIQKAFLTFEESAKELGVKDDLVQKAWDEANKVTPKATENSPIPIEAIPGEPFDLNHYYFKYDGKYYKVEKGFSSDSTGVKGISAHHSITHGAINLLIARDCKTDEEKRARIYIVLMDWANDYRGLRNAKVMDENGNPEVFGSYNTAEELADAWGIERNPIMEYVLDVASGKRKVDYNDLPPKIRLAIPTEFVTAYASSTTQISKLVEQPNKEAKATAGKMADKETKREKESSQRLERYTQQLKKVSTKLSVPFEIKRLHLVIALLVIVLLGIGVLIYSRIDRPDYKATQVLYMVENYADWPQGGSWSTEYVGQGKWIVRRTLTSGSERIWNFDEQTGQVTIGKKP